MYLIITIQLLVIIMDFNSRYYLIESIQQVVDVIGSNCVLTGLNIINHSLINNQLTVNLSKGKIICDSTLIYFPNDLDLPLDLGTLPTQGRIILSVNYRYLRTSRPNFAAISLKYLDNSNYCTEWFQETDKIVLAVLYYNKSNNFIYYEESTVVQQKNIIINNITYEIHPFNYTIQQLRPILLQLLQ